MRLIIADPPYLGRAALWHSGQGRRWWPGIIRTRGHSLLDAEYQPDAHIWDDPQSQMNLMPRLEGDSDGWPMGASAKTLPATAPGIPPAARIAVWHVTNAIPRRRRRTEPLGTRHRPGARHSLPIVLGQSHGSAPG